MQTAEVVEFPMTKTPKYLGVSIDLERDKKMSEQALKLVSDYYCKDGETSPQQAYARAQSHIPMVIWNSHKEFMTTFHRGGSCMRHLYCQTHPCLQRKGQGFTYLMFFNLCSRFIRRSY